MSAIEILRSHVIPEVGFIHGFPTRHGGVSSGSRASLNLGYRWGDDPANVDENRRLLATEVGFDVNELIATKHVHGTRIWRVADALPDPAEFDGLVCDRVGPVLGAFAADCMPVLFADPDARLCGACHAGWRGTVAGIGRELVAGLMQLGSDPRSIRVAMGPSIGPCCFEVGDEVVDEFRAALPGVEGVVVDGPRKRHINMRRAMRAILERAGVYPEHIDDEPSCTKCNPDRFFSYRRDGREGGVHMGYIGLRDLTTCD